MPSIRAVLKLLLSLALLYGAYYGGRGGYYIMVHSPEFDQHSAAQYARLVPTQATIVSAVRKHSSDEWHNYYIWTVHYLVGPLDGKTFPGTFEERDNALTPVPPRYKEGDKVTVYYDPQSPAYNQTKQWYDSMAATHGQYPTAWMGAIFLLVSLALLIGGGLLLPRAVLQLLGKKPATKE